jgi:hypothetical protein
MKKYLMTGIAAVALCAAFTSCSHDLTPMSQEEINQLEAQKIVNTYNSAFIAKFGQPAANQDWGFGSGASARTRANTGDNYSATHKYKDAAGNVVAGANMNCNEWADPEKEFGGWEVVPALKKEQKEVVTAYFKSHPNLGYKDPELRHFFVQQVYKGVTGTNEGITDADNTTYNSDVMNLLTVGQANSHINNFNGGTCTERDVLDNGQSVGGKTHKDQITLMVNVDDTSCFGYHETASSTHHNNKAGLVGWSTIHEWAKTNYSGYVEGFAGWLDDGYNRSYMGFDLALKEGTEAYATDNDGNVLYANCSEAPGQPKYGWDGTNIFPIVETTEKSNEWGQTWLEYGDYLPQYKELVGYLTTNKNFYVDGGSVTLSQTYSGFSGNAITTKSYENDFKNYVVLDEVYVEGAPNNKAKVLNLKRINELIADDYLPVNSKSLTEWVKVGKSDGYFSDWIVTLTEAKRKDVVDPNEVRIIAEDLTPSTTDWDFNDVVFDVKFNDAGTSAEVTLIKAGGTLELTVDGHEVHAAFGYPEPDPTTGRYKMINTGAKADVNGAVAQPFTVSCNKSNRGNDIVIRVNKGTKENPNWITLEAKQGQPAAKLAVKTTFLIPDERVNIETYYPNFLKYVKDPSVIWW